MAASRTPLVRLCHIRDEIAALTAVLHGNSFEEFAADCRSDVGALCPSITLRDAGERAAINLAKSVEAKLLLIDDRAGDAAARAHGLTTTGTLGVLVKATQLGLIDLHIAFSRLRTTNFRCRPELLDSTLAKYGARR